MKKVFFVFVLMSGLVIGGCSSPQSSNKKEIQLLNVSYDPTRELYQNFNKSFADYWKKKTGQTVVVTQSHGGSGKQARAVIDGLKADVVTLALGYDIDAIAQNGLLTQSWENQFANHSAPYTSTVVFVVRKGNPKEIKDWNDLIRDKVAVITANPKSSGGARWNYLAAWSYATEKYGNEKDTLNFMKQLYKNVEVLDSGSRASTTTFVERKIGDVLIAWENEAYLIQKEYPNEYEIVYPSISILAEPPVAVVDKNTKAHGTEEVAKAYLQYLYSKEGQEMAAQNFYRPIDKDVAQQYSEKFPTVQMTNIRDDFGGWSKAQKEHFADGGTFDQIYKK